MDPRTDQRRIENLRLMRKPAESLQDMPGEMVGPSAAGHRSVQERHCADLELENASLKQALRVIASEMALEVVARQNAMSALEKEQIVRKRADELLADLAAQIWRREDGLDRFRSALEWAQDVREYFTPEYFDEQFLGKPIGGAK